MSRRKIDYLWDFIEWMICVVLSPARLIEFAGSTLFLVGLAFGSNTPVGSVCFLVGSVAFMALAWAKELWFMMVLNLVGTCILGYQICRSLTWVTAG